MIVAVVSLLAGSTGSSAQDAQRRASERLRALQAEAEQLLAAEKTLLVELRRLEVERDIRLEEQREAEAGLAAASAELAATTGHLESLERVQSAQVPGLAARLREVYKLGNGGYLRLLLSVDDVRDMGRAYRTVAALAALDRQRVRAHQTTVDLPAGGSGGAGGPAQGVGNARGQRTRVGELGGHGRSRPARPWWPGSTRNGI